MADEEQKDGPKAGDLLPPPEQQYPEPSYPEPSYPEPSYPEPSYPDPLYPEPLYPEPSYPESSYPEPFYPEPYNQFEEDRKDTEELENIVEHLSHNSGTVVKGERLNLVAARNDWVLVQRDDDERDQGSSTGGITFQIGEHDKPHGQAIGLAGSVYDAGVVHLYNRFFVIGAPDEDAYVHNPALAKALRETGNAILADGVLTSEEAAQIKACFPALEEDKTIGTRISEAAKGLVGLNPTVEERLEPTAQCITNIAVSNEQETGRR